jgi:hypothetical protein
MYKYISIYNLISVTIIPRNKCTPSIHKEDVGILSKFGCTLYTKECIDTSKFTQTCDILLWTEVVIKIYGVRLNYELHYDPN